MYYNALTHRNFGYIPQIPHLVRGPGFIAVSTLLHNLSCCLILYLKKKTKPQSCLWLTVIETLLDTYSWLYSFPPQAQIGSIMVWLGGILMTSCISWNKLEPEPWKAHHGMSVVSPPLLRPVALTSTRVDRETLEKKQTKFRSICEVWGVGVCVCKSVWFLFRVGACPRALGPWGQRLSRPPRMWVTLDRGSRRSRKAWSSRPSWWARRCMEGAVAGPTGEAEGRTARAGKKRRADSNSCDRRRSSTTTKMRYGRSASRSCRLPTSPDHPRGLDTRLELERLTGRCCRSWSMLAVTRWVTDILKASIYCFHGKLLAQKWLKASNSRSLTFICQLAQPFFSFPVKINHLYPS